MRFPRALSSLVLAPALAGAAVVAAPTTSSAATPPVKITYIRYDSVGSDTGSSSSLNGEYVVIKNVTTSNRSLTGWTLKDRTGYTYRFPTFTLRAGASVTVHTGKGSATTAHRYYNRTWYVWNNTGDTAYLRDAAGALRHSCAWTSLGNGYRSC
jgi:hypothetical protein